jgi:hypothetical protein
MSANPTPIEKDAPVEPKLVSTVNKLMDNVNSLETTISAIAKGVLPSEIKLTAVAELISTLIESAKNNRCLKQIQAKLAEYSSKSPDKQLTQADVKIITSIAKASHWLKEKATNTVKEKLDFNKDGKLDHEDLKIFLTTTNVLWSIVIGVLITAFLDTITNWFEKGIWNWDIILICAKFDIIPAVVAFIKKMFDKSDVIKNAQIQQLKNDIQSKDLANQLLQQKVDLQLVNPKP